MDYGLWDKNNGNYEFSHFYLPSARLRGVEDARSKPRLAKQPTGVRREMQRLLKRTRKVLAHWHTGRLQSADCGTVEVEVWLRLKGVEGV